MARILNRSPEAEGRYQLWLTRTRLAITPVQKVVVVDGNARSARDARSVLDAGRYDMVFVESSDHAYSQIKKVLPNLVIVCARIEQLEVVPVAHDAEARLETRDIPVLTYTTDARARISTPPPLD